VYQTLDSSPRETAPMTTAPGAINAVAGTVGRTSGRKNDGKSPDFAGSMEFMALEPLILLEFWVDRF
jgi:hypothetical protein